MAYLLVAILSAPVSTKPNISCSHDPVHHWSCETTEEEGGEVEEEGGWRKKYSIVQYSISQYTSVYPVYHSIYCSILEYTQYTTVYPVYHSIPHLQNGDFKV